MALGNMAVVAVADEDGCLANAVTGMAKLVESMLTIKNVVPKKAEPLLIHPKMDNNAHIDPLLNDGLIYQPIRRKAPTAKTTHYQPSPFPTILDKRYLPIYSDTKTKETLASLRHWVNDALESSAMFGLKLPVQSINEQLVMAETYETYGDQYRDTGEIRRSQYAYQKAADYLYDATHQAMPSTALETRAIWLDRKSIVNSKSPRALRKLIKRLADTGINLIYFETLNAGYPIYPSKIIPQNPLALGWDPLEVAVKEAHKQGIELHAWVWAFAVGNTRHNPLIGKNEDFTSPFFNTLSPQQHAMQMRNGSIMPPRQTEYWMSPASTEGRQALKNVFHEIAANYAVDGLHLDYIRYPFQRGNDPAGYEPVSRQKYALETHHSVQPSAHFTRWKTQLINSFVHEVSDDVKAVNPNIMLSAAVFPMARAQRIAAIQQDWETWLDEGWVDTVSPMVYTTSPHLFKQSLKGIFNSVDKPEAIYPGVALFRLDGDELLNHMQLIQQLGGKGLTLFASAHLNADLQQLLQSGPYKSEATYQPHRDSLTNYKELTKQYIQRLSVIEQQPQLLQNMPMVQQKEFGQDMSQLKQQLAILNTLNLSQGSSNKAQWLTEQQATLSRIQKRLDQWYPLSENRIPYRVLCLHQWTQDLIQLQDKIKRSSSHNIQVAAH
jgi:uncharacterized lipoprotein YddW (UPF0748 family)